jgi:hypothetical protein
MFSLGQQVIKLTIKILALNHWVVTCDLQYAEVLALSIFCFIKKGNAAARRCLPVPFLLFLSSSWTVGVTVME